MPFVYISLRLLELNHDEKGKILKRPLTVSIRNFIVKSLNVFGFVPTLISSCVLNSGIFTSYFEGQRCQTAIHCHYNYLMQLRF